MNQLTSRNVVSVIAKAVRAGKTTPTIAQLQTLASAVGTPDAIYFFKNATLRDRVAIKNCIAQMVFGKEPKQTAKDAVTVFGKEAPKSIAAGDLKRGLPEKAERVSEEQKDIATRKTTEEFHPETSDRKERSAVVAEPLATKTDFKEILDRGPKAQDKAVTASLLALHANRIRMGESPEVVLADYARQASSRTYVLKTLADVQSGDQIQVPMPTGTANVKVEQVDNSNPQTPAFTGRTPEGLLVTVQQSVPAEATPSPTDQNTTLTTQTTQQAQ